MEKELKETDILFFPTKLVFKEYGDDLLVISPHTANWIVINKTLKDCLNEFINKTPIGIVINKYSKDAENVLKAIVAQDFAGINEPISVVNLHEFNTLSILLTNKCNLRCKHCYLYSGKVKENELTLEDWKKVVLDFHKNGGKYISFSGGEPMLFDGLLDIVKYAKSLGLYVKLYSNGLLWDELSIENFSKYIDWIQISLDGYDEPTNSAIRGKGHFDKALKTILNFSNYKISVHVATTLDTTILNSETKYKYAELVNKIKKDNISFALTKRFIKGRNVNLSYEENNIYEREIREISEYVNKNNKTSFITSCIKNGVVKNCGIGCLTIDSCGNVYGCSRIEQLKSFGNVKNNSFLYYIEKGKELCDSTSVDTMEECRNCHLRYICGGGCKLDTCNVVNNKFIHNKCSIDYKKSIEKRMIISFKEYYNFN